MSEINGDEPQLGGRNEVTGREPRLGGDKKPVGFILKEWWDRAVVADRDHLPPNFTGMYICREGVFHYEKGVCVREDLDT